VSRESYAILCSESSEILPQVLVGPTDWKEHASGKSPDRFRASNLPSHFDGAGIYELGVTPPTWLPPQRKSDPVFLKPQDVVVVYLGCADNVLHHLQRYGQTGAHLEGARLVQPLQSTGTIQHFNTSLWSNSISFPSRAGQRDCSLRGMKPRAEQI
jgi:hypothetical protein